MRLFELIKEIERDPGNFLQSDCIFQLRAFLRGYVFSKNINQKGFSEEHEVLTKFDAQLKERYGVSPEEVVSVEEMLTDFEGENAFQKYLELWSAHAGGS